MMCNFLFVDFSPKLPPVDELLSLCQSQRLLLLQREKHGNFPTSDHCFRVAVKDAAKNRRTVEILSSIVQNFE